MADAETKSFTGGLYGVAMDRKIAEWKLGIERIWSAAAPDYQEAARLVAAMASVTREAPLPPRRSQAPPPPRRPHHHTPRQNTPAAPRAAPRRFSEIRPPPP